VASFVRPSNGFPPGAPEGFDFGPVVVLVHVVPPLNPALALSLNSNSKAPNDLLRVRPSFLIFHYYIPCESHVLLPIPASLLLV